MALAPGWLQPQHDHLGKVELLSSPTQYSSLPSVRYQTGGHALPQPQSDANPNLYVHNVPKDSNEEELRKLFGQFGTVERVRLKVNQKVGPHAVYAFVTFASTAEAQVALTRLQGSDIRGRALRIEFQRTASAGSSNRLAAAAESADFDSNITEPLNLSSSTSYHRNTSPTALTTTSGFVQSYDDRTDSRKRGRNQSRSPMRAAKARLISPTDAPALIDALKELLAARHPESLGLIKPVADLLATAETKWPSSELDTRQQTLVREGHMVLDPQTNRWRVAVSPLLPPVKPQLFNPVRPPLLYQPLPAMEVAPPIVHQAIVPPPAHAPPVAQPQRPPTAYAPPIPAPLARPPVPVASPTTVPMDDSWSQRLGPIAPVFPYDERPIVWSGTLARNDKKKTLVTLRRFCGFMEHDVCPPPDIILKVSHRSPYEEMVKKEMCAIALLEPATADQGKLLREYVQYFTEKNRAGVVKLDRPDWQMIYLAPLTMREIAEKLSPHLHGVNFDEVMLAFVARNVAQLD